MADEMRTTGVNLVLGPRGIRIDEKGRITFLDPEILNAVISGRPAGLESAADGNSIQCTCNNYQCGKGLQAPSAGLGTPTP